MRFNLLLLRMNQKLKCIFIERENFLFFLTVRYEKIVHETEKKKRNYSIDDLNDFGFFSFTISKFFMPKYFSTERAPDYDQTVTE